MALNCIILGIQVPPAPLSNSGTAIQSESHPKNHFEFGNWRLKLLVVAFNAVITVINLNRKDTVSHDIHNQFPVGTFTCIWL